MEKKIDLKKNKKCNKQMQENSYTGEFNTLYPCFLGTFLKPQTTLTNHSVCL